MAEALLQLKKVSKYYVNGNNVVAGLNRASLTLYRGEFVAITGESGSGKSTLGHILSGVLPYEDGEMYFRGAPTSHFDSIDWENYRKDHISFISQNYGILPGATVLDHILSALRLCGESKLSARNRAMEILEQVELADVAHRRAAKLSSGQKQRLSIARALAKPCDILIADEPTGNLDPENSEKVIRLLAQAAKERLVVIITHEYSEVADFVTRHIRLQDSLVCGDTVLREKAECPPTAVKVSHKQKLAPYVARIQLRSRPAWCGAVGLFFALTAFAIFVFLGSFIVALDDTPTRIFEPDAFRNGDMLRIAVVRKDGNNLTEEDYASVLDTEYVSHLERFGYIADLNYYYQEDKDFRYVYTNKNYGSKLDPVYMVDESIELLHSDNFLQTMPLTKDGSSIVTTGRDPENFYEIVVCGAPEWIGRTIPVYLRDVRKWAIGEYLVFDMTVVGVTDQGKGLYFHEDVGRMMTLQYFHGFCVFPQTEMVYTPVKYIDYVDCDTKKPFHTEIEWTEETVARPILDKEVTISFNRYKYLVEDRGNNYYDLYYCPMQGDSGFHYNVGLHKSTFTSSFGFSPKVFRQYMDGNIRNDQLSVYITDYAYTDRVIQSLDAKGYLAISPFVLGSAKVDEDLAAKRVQTLTISLSALAAVLVLQLIVLKAMFGMENEAYQIFSSVGLPYKTAKNSLLLQILCFTVLGQALGLGAVALCSHFGIQRIVNVTKYLLKPYWALLCLVHLLSAAAVAAIVVRSLRKRVYPISSRQGDLTLDDGGEEATV